MLERPLKLGDVRRYSDEVNVGFDDILAEEIDADLDTIYAYANAPGIWIDDPDNNRIVPSGSNRTIYLPAMSEGVKFQHSNYPTVDRRTGIGADDTTLRIFTGNLGAYIFNHDQSATLGQIYADGRWSIGADPTGLLDVTTKRYVDARPVSKWRTAGSLLMPLNPSYTITSAPVSNAYRWGGLSGAMLSRLSDWGDGSFDWRINVRSSEPQNMDDPLAAGWSVALTAIDDVFRISRTPPGATAAWQQRFQVSANGRATVAEGIVIGALNGTPQPGMIQYAGGHFQGYNGTAWVNLD